MRANPIEVWLELETEAEATAFADVVDAALESPRGRSMESPRGRSMEELLGALRKASQKARCPQADFRGKFLPVGVRIDAASLFVLRQALKKAEDYPVEERETLAALAALLGERSL
jgi:hypothetical protein